MLNRWIVQFKSSDWLGQHGIFLDILRAFLIKELFDSRLLDMRFDYSQRGATRLVGYLPSHIQRALVDLKFNYDKYMIYDIGEGYSKQGIAGGERAAVLRLSRKVHTTKLFL